MKPFTVSSPTIPCPPPRPLAPFGFRISTSALLFAFALHASAALAADRQVVRGHLPSAVAALQPLNRLPASQRLALAIGLPLRNQAELTAFLRDLYDPASPNYRSYLTPQQFTERFGPSQQDYQSLIDFAKASGFTIKTHPNRVILNVDAAVADIEKAFHLTMRVYQHPVEARTFYAPDTEPALDLSASVLHISGLDNFTLPHPKNLKRQPPPRPDDITPKNGAGPGGTYMGSDFRAAYVPGTSLTGAGQVLGLLEFDGFFPGDIATYESIAGLPSVPLQVVLLDGFNGAPGPGNVEVALDIEVAIAMAPGLSQIILYEGSLPETVFNQMANDNLASQVSCSWGWGGGPSRLLDQIFQQMAAQGQSVFDASGDVDAFPPGAVDDPTRSDAPSDDPYITQVGGTTLTTSGPGGAWVSETVWQRGGGVGSSGGISSYYPIPFWQQGVNMSTNGGSTSFRNL
ncbi:MAG: protease pro-enzyme activation domain-containing protein, partial [Verrucomicrobiota bacterium]